MGIWRGVTPAPSDDPGGSSVTGKAELRSRLIAAQRNLQATGSDLAPSLVGHATDTFAKRDQFIRRDAFVHFVQPVGPIHFDIN
jgi:hypothetical protein